MKIRAVRTEVYSRIVGYYRPVQAWNKGKREEFKDREYIKLPTEKEMRDDQGREGEEPQDMEPGRRDPA